MRDLEQVFLVTVKGIFFWCGKLKALSYLGALSLELENERRSERANASAQVLCVFLRFMA